MWNRINDAAALTHAWRFNSPVAYGGKTKPRTTAGLHFDGPAGVAGRRYRCGLNTTRLTLVNQVTAQD